MEREKIKTRSEISSKIQTIEKGEAMGIIFGDGVVMGDGILVGDGVVMGDGIMLAD